jgi:predicted RNA-binding Zn-ribbon protein involved in translation (DUF1610 family)
MTVHRIKDTIAFSCDECPETIDTNEHDFTAAWDHARALGWRAQRNVEGQFEHECPNCAEIMNP